MGLKIWGKIRLTGMIKELEAVEKAHAAGVDPTELLNRLDEFDRKTATIYIPRSMVHDDIDNRQFLHDMRDRIKASKPAEIREPSSLKTKPVSRES
jgi:hypothetical protein